MCEDMSLSDRGLLNSVIEEEFVQCEGESSIAYVRSVRLVVCYMCLV